MLSERKQITLVSRLNEMTQNRVLNWTAQKPWAPLLDGTDDNVVGFYVCEWKGQALAIYERRFHQYVPEFDSFHWSNAVELAFRGPSGEIAYTLSHVEGLCDLYDNVRFIVGKVGDVIDDLLKEDE